MTDTPTDDDANYWAAVQKFFGAALRDYEHTDLELFDLIKSNEYFNSMTRNVFAKGWVRGNMAALRKAPYHRRTSAIAIRSIPFNKESRDEDFSNTNVAFRMHNADVFNGRRDH